MLSGSGQDKGPGSKGLVALRGWVPRLLLGVADLETDGDAVLRYRARLQPGLSGAMTDVLTINSEIVTGYRLRHAQPADEIVRIAE